MPCGAEFAPLSASRVGQDTLTDIPPGVYGSGMTTKQITKDNLEETLGGGGVVVLDFWAAWCAPCRSFGPVFERAADANPDVVFGKVDTEAEQELARGFGITSIPTLMAFRDGVLVYSQPGAMNQSGLAKVLDAVRGLDMDEVQRELAAQSSAGGSR